MAYRYVGLGAVMSADGTDFSYPSYCSYSFATDPFGVMTLVSDLTDPACQPPTPAQLTAMQTAQLAKVAAVNPSAAAAGVVAGNVAVADLAKTDPNAADYYANLSSPTLDALLGPTATNWLNGVNPTNIDPTTGLPKSTSIPGWVWVAGIGAVGAAIFLGGRR